MERGICPTAMVAVVYDSFCECLFDLRTCEKRTTLAYRLGERHQLGL